MKAEQIIFDERLISCIRCLEKWSELFDEANKVTKKRQCDETIQLLKVLAFDTAQRIPIDDKEGDEYVLKPVIHLPGNGFTLWTDQSIPTHTEWVNDSPWGIELWYGYDPHARLCGCLDRFSDSMAMFWGRDNRNHNETKYYHFK